MVKRPVNQKQKGAPYGVGVHGEERHRGAGCDRKRGGELTSEARSASLSALERTRLLEDRRGKGTTWWEKRSEMQQQSEMCVSEPSQAMTSGCPGPPTCDCRPVMSAPPYASQRFPCALLTEAGLSLLRCIYIYCIYILYIYMYSSDHIYIYIYVLKRPTHVGPKSFVVLLLWLFVHPVNGPRKACGQLLWHLDCILY